LGDTENSSHAQMTFASSSPLRLMMAVTGCSMTWKFPYVWLLHRLNHKHQDHGMLDIFHH
jgi:hypothetical protein